MTNDTFSFTWGASLEGLGYVQVFNFMLHHYTELGVTRAEMLLIIHLASYKFNTEAGESRPSLATIQEQMGYSRRATMTDLVNSLEEKGLLKVDRHEGPDGKPSGYPSTYDAEPFAQACLARWRETLTPERNSDTLTVQRKGTVTVQRNPPLRCTVTEEDEEKTKVKTKLPAPQPAQVPELEYDYDDLDGSGGDPNKTEQGWMQPELPIHHQVLGVAHAKRFQKTRWKMRLTGLGQAIASGDILGDGVYQACLDGLDKCENGVVQEPLPPIPASWLDWRLEQARRNRWSVGGTVDALFSREALVRHCQYHLREMGAAVPAKEVQYEDADLGAVEVINL